MALAAGCTRPARAAPERSGARQRQRLQTELSDRDHAILNSLDHFRLLTTNQLRSLHFHDHQTLNAAARICRGSVARLHRQRLIEHLERRIGGLRAGSASYVWRLGPVGDRLLRQAAGDDRHARRKEPSARHLDHCLAVADCYLTLLACHRQRHIELVSFATEPACWRRFMGYGGGREILKPDLYTVTASGDYEDHWFFEVDRATESLPTVLKKCAQYERYRRTGQTQAEAGVFPLVVWLVPDERRQRQIVGGLRSSRQLDTGLFRVVTSPQLPDLLRAGGGAA